MVDQPAEAVNDGYEGVCGVTASSRIGIRVFSLTLLFFFSVSIVPAFCPFWLLQRLSPVYGKKLGGYRTAANEILPIPKHPFRYTFC